MLDIYFGDNLPVLREMPDRSVNLIYIDPPFNTGKMQLRTSMTTVSDEEGDRIGFKGKRYKTIRKETRGYNDVFDDLPAFLRPRMEEARRILSDDGSLFFHIDYREVHYCKVMLDEIFGRDSFINEIIWAYDYGARSRRRWSAKHDNILWYAKNPADYTFNYESVDRIPYMAPSLVGPKKAARGKTPTDVWWHTIVSPTGQEKTGYATQKPLGILRRIVAVHSKPGDLLCDFFAGSGSFGAAALEQGRGCILVDENPAALHVMERRFAPEEVIWHNWLPGLPEEKPESAEVPKSKKTSVRKSTTKKSSAKSGTKTGSKTKKALPDKAVKATVSLGAKSAKKTAARKTALKVLIDPDSSDVKEATLALQSETDTKKKTLRKSPKKALAAAEEAKAPKKTKSAGEKDKSAAAAVKKSSVKAGVRKTSKKALSGEEEEVTAEKSRTRGTKAGKRAKEKAPLREETDA